MTIYSEALESKFALLKTAASRIMSGKTHPSQTRVERLFLPSAEPYYWSHAITQAVLTSSETLPEETAVSLADIGFGKPRWFWFERPINFDNGPQNIRGILWNAEPDNAGRPHAGLFLYSGDLDALTFSEACVVAEKTRIKDQTVGVLDLPNGVYQWPNSKSVLAFFIAAILWMDQKIIVDRPQVAERATRRRLSREGVTHFSPIRVVQLRKAMAGKAYGREATVEWSCQWLVKGHWRPQYYPSTREHRSIWILPHVKGPEGAPFKAPSTTVFAVTR